MSIESAEAGVVYEAAPDQLTSFNLDPLFQLANPFDLTTTATIGAVRFWAFSVFGTFPGSITWEIANSNPGYLGLAENVLASGEVVPTYTATGTPVKAHAGANKEFAVDFDIPTLTIGPGRYYLILHAGPLSQTAIMPYDDFSWEASDDNLALEHLYRTAPFLPGWGQETFNLAMEFFEPAVTPPTTPTDPGSVPEPGTMTLFGLGMLAMLGRSRATRRRGGWIDPARPVYCSPRR